MEFLWIYVCVTNSGFNLQPCLWHASWSHFSERERAVFCSVSDSRSTLLPFTLPQRAWGTYFEALQGSWPVEKQLFGVPSQSVLLCWLLSLASVLCLLTVQSLWSWVLLLVVFMQYYWRQWHLEGVTELRTWSVKQKPWHFSLCIPKQK